MRHASYALNVRFATDSPPPPPRGFPAPVSALIEGHARAAAAWRCRTPWRGLDRLRGQLRRLSVDEPTVDRAVTELAHRTGLVPTEAA